jgi:type IV pilus assembly protein PilE
MRHPIHPRLRLAGFTLMELMIAVVVVGILASIAYPAFTSTIQRSRRADAIAALSALMQAQERYRSNHATYADKLDTLNVNVEKVYKYYDVSFSGIGESGFRSGYVVTATPKTGGSQASDRDCATLSIRLDGSIFRYEAVDSKGVSSARQCWGRDHGAS